MRFRRVALVAAIVVLCAGVLFALAFAPVVRARAGKEAARRNLDIEIGHVAPGYFAVSLRDVVIKPRGVEGVSLSLAELRVEASATLAVQGIYGHGGRLQLDGEPDVLRERLTAFRSQLAPSGGAPTGARSSSADIAVDGVDLIWRGVPGGDIAARGLSARKTEKGYHLGAGWAKGGLGDLHLELEDGEVDWTTGTGLERARARTATVELSVAPLPKDKPAPVEAAQAAPAPVPPPAPVPVAVRVKGKGAAKETGPDPNAGKPFVKMPELRKAYARIQTIARALGERLPEGGSVEVHELRIRLHVKGSDLSLGPGPFAVLHRPGIVHGTYSTSPESGGPSFSVRADVPTQGDVRVELTGGPLPLSSLGIQEGDLGVVAPQKGTVEATGRWILGNQGAELTFDAQLRLRGISVSEPRLAAEVMRGVDAAVGGRGMLTDEGVLRLDDASLELGQLRASAHGTFEQLPDHVAMNLNAEVHPATCQGILGSLPSALVPTIKSAHVSGTFTASARLVFDTRKLDELVLDHHIGNSCRFVEVPLELSRDRFSHSFVHHVYGPDGKLREVQTGPGSSNWTELDHISPFMQVAVLTTEDGGFFKHRGFNHGAFRNSLVANLKARRFVRGASTISMQLAKNLFLRRDKTLGRKLEELLLTDYLEQNFSKDEMMELYLNVIEFGPNIYGVTQAAEHFFGRKPEELNLTESMYLASVLPSPVRYHGNYDVGHVPEAWMKHLHLLMVHAQKTHRITTSELGEALGQSIEFYKSSSPRPTPRPAVASTRREGAAEDEWQPVDDPNSF